MTLFLPGGLDAVLGVLLEIEAAGAGEQVNFLQDASERTPAIVEVALAVSHIGFGRRPTLVWELAAIVQVVT